MTGKDETGDTDIVLRTRYETRADEVVIHRELWMELAGPAASIDEAITLHAEMAGVIGSVLTLCGNAVVEEPQLELCFDATSGENEHEIFQNGIVDERGMPRITRHLDGDAFTKLFASLVANPDRDRLLRATSQYQTGVQYMQPGKQVLALAHLYMAVENLTKVAAEAHLAGIKGDVQAALRSWGVKPKQNQHERNLFDAEVRRRLIFQEDTDVYRGAKAASDGFEHGFMGMNKVREHALAHARATAKYVREAILLHSGLDDSIRSQLVVESYAEPLPSTPMAKYIRATLVGAPDELAPSTQQYPMFRINLSIQGTKYEGDQVEVTPKVEVTNLVGENVLVKNPRFEFWGPGPVAAQDQSAVPSGQQSSES